MLSVVEELVTLRVSQSGSRGGPDVRQIEVPFMELFATSVVYEKAFVDLNPNRGRDQGRQRGKFPLVGSFGRITRCKSQDVLIKAFADRMEDSTLEQTSGGLCG